MVIKDNRKADRAKQFIPFDALKGFKEALRAKEKIKSEKKELTEEEINEISKTLKNVNKRDIVKVIFYKNQEYIELEGMVSNIDFTLKTIKIIKEIILFDDIIVIKIQNKYEI
jgi:mannose-6-phosphate isomerase class I